MGLQGRRDNLQRVAKGAPKWAPSGSPEGRQQVSFTEVAKLGEVGGVSIMAFL